MCGVCESATSITGTVTDCNSGNPLGNVEVFAGDNLLDPLTETDVTGSFQLTNMCATDLELYFYKYGYTSEQEFYTYSGSSPTIKMCANCKYALYFFQIIFKLPTFYIKYNVLASQLHS